MAADGPTGAVDADRLNDLADRLSHVIESLDDVMFEMLRAARAEGAATRPVADRTLTQARRSLEKAEHLLRRTAETAERKEY